MIDTVFTCSGLLVSLMLCHADLWNWGYLIPPLCVSLTNSSELILTQPVERQGIFSGCLWIWHHPFLFLMLLCYHGERSFTCFPDSPVLPACATPLLRTHCVIALVYTVVAFFDFVCLFLSQTDHAWNTPSCSQHSRPVLSDPWGVLQVNPHRCSIPNTYRSQVTCRRAKWNI